MSTLLDTIEKLQSTQEAIRRTKELLAKHPRDYGMLANITSLEKRALSLEEDFLAEASTEHLDICTYRMFADERKTYPILAVGSALSDLQRWFSTVYDALKHGPKRRAKLAPETVQQSTLDFAFAFTGSIGVAMTIPSERLLFDNDLQRAIQKVVEMAGADSSEKIYHFAKEVGAASVSAMYRWVSDHVASGTGAEIKWMRNQAEVVAGTFEKHQLADLGRAIEQTSEETEETLNVVGDLVGADINRHTFHLVFEEAEEIRGTMAESIGLEYTVELPRRYMAVIRKISFVNYAKDEEYVKYHLLELKDAQQPREPDAR